ncbi:LVIVD repeat-containing protein [Egicoccus sp. AB-alg6-2]|uniref:LVIVD repeat-containing protein n=1 Tax=Egicoccus sp. AB-alg6-2 TaxID=3242692 RepID=UPI00359D738D
MPARTPLSLLAVVAVGSLALVPAPDLVGGVLDGTGAGPMEHVANVPYANAHGTGPNQGTDLEFATIPVARTVEERVGLGRGGGAVRTRTEVEDRTFVFAGTYTNGLQILDVTDPGRPRPVAVYDCAIAQGDVQVFERDARWYVTYTRDLGYASQTRTDSACFREAEALGFGARDALGPGTFVVDVTDPHAPTLASFVSFPKGSHNQTVHPSGDYLYNSNSELITSVVGEVGIEVVDIRDLAAPVQVAFVPLPIRPGLGTESHDITFNADGTRAYSAALSQTVIIDTTDPADPSVVSSFVDPAINVEHQANPVTLTDPILGRREFLVVEDEVAGASPTGQCPNGGVHVYDITGDLERTPRKVGYWNIRDVGLTTDGLGTCTAHVFEIHEDEALMTIAFYNGGVRVVDLSGLVGVALGELGVGMREVASFRFQDSDTWAVKAPSVSRDRPFHVYGNDIARGLDVYRVDLSKATAGTGLDQWLSAEQALLQLPSEPLSPTELADIALRCKLPTAS